MNENICAISTALGVGAISIVRASGPEVIMIANEIFEGKDLTQVPSHTIHYGHIVENKEKIDEVLVSVMRAPRTFTMEDVVEINCHGGIATTHRVLEALLLHGCRMAEPGEFSKKGFLNGRIDLTEAEGINDLIASETEEARKYAMNLVGGNLKAIIQKSRDVLVSLDAELEVNFDFPEEADNPEITHDKLKTALLHIKEDLEKLIASSKEGKLLKNGIDIAILGKPNVGKSSILNHLLDEKKAIVTDIAGTTRDIVEGTTTLSGIKINLLDTAGLRETEDIVEKIGVDKSKDIVTKADLVLYVLNNNEEIDDKELEYIHSLKNVQKILFINKNDLESKIDKSVLNNDEVAEGNTLTPNGLDQLKERIVSLFHLNEIKGKNYNFLSNARQTALAKKAYASIESAITSVEEFMPFEMIAVDIKNAFDELGEIIGVTYKEELLDELFSKFCLGK